MSITLHHILEALFNPFFIALFILACTLIMLFIRGNTPSVRIGFLMVFIVFIVCSTGWLPYNLTTRLEGQYKIVEKVDPSIHWVVVLGGGHDNGLTTPANQLLNSVSLERLVEGVRLYRQLPAATLLLSGGGIKAGPSEAAHLSVLTTWFAIPDHDILLEDHSINTKDQAIAIKKMLQDEPFYLVTSAIHMPRSMALFQQQGLKPLAAPTDFTHYWSDSQFEQFYIPNARNLHYLSIAWHEILGRIWSNLTKSS